MTKINNKQILPPNNWTDFEDLCHDVWKSSWNDIEAQKNGRRGQAQHGVDIYGQPQGTTNWEGVQCKGKDNFLKQTLTESELLSEVEKAKSFIPALSKFTIVTTAPNDQRIQKVARKITSEHEKKGLFKVIIVSWQELLKKIEGLSNCDELIKQHLSIETDTLRLEKKIDQNSENIIRESLNSEFHLELNHAKTLINTLQFPEAKNYLEQYRSEKWSRLDNALRYRLLHYLGKVELNLVEDGNCEVAGEYFRDALQYKSDDLEAQAFYAYGLTLLGEFEQAKALATKIITLDQYNPIAHSILLQHLTPDEAIKRSIEEMPKSLLQSVEVSHVLAEKYLALNNHEKAHELIDTALDKDNLNHPDLKIAKAKYFINQVMIQDQVRSSKLLTHNDVELIEAAENLIDTAIAQIQHTAFYKYRSNYLYFKSICKYYLDQVDLAINELEKAITLNQRDVYLKELFVLCIEAGDPVRHIKAAKLVCDLDLTLGDDLPLKVAHFYLDEIPSNLDSAIKVLEDYVALKELNPELFEIGLSLLSILYAKRNHEGDIEKGEKLLNREVSIKNLIDKYLFYKEIGKKKINLLVEAKELLNEKSSFREVVTLAEQFYQLNDFTSAAELYEKVIDPDLHSELTRRLVISYYKSKKVGEKKKALEIANRNRLKYPDIKFYSQICIDLYLAIQDSNNACSVYEDYIKNTPRDISAKINYAILKLKAGDRNPAELLLESEIIFESLTAQDINGLAFLYSELNNFAKAIEILYEGRRKFTDNIDIHHNFIFIFQTINSKKELTDFLDHGHVRVGSAITLENSDGDLEKWIIEDRNDISFDKKEIGFTHPISKAVLGKFLNDSVVVKGKYIDQDWKIVQIQSKYSFAWNEAIKEDQYKFPHKSIVQTLRLKISPEGGLNKEVLNQILSLGSQDETRIRTIEGFYKSHKIPIASIAKWLNKSIFEILNAFSSSKELGIRCAIGELEERQVALSDLNSSKYIVFDLTALFSLQRLGLMKKNLRGDIKFAVTRSIIEELEHYIQEIARTASNGRIMLHAINEEIYFSKETPKEVKKYQERLNEILIWINANCDILPIPKLLDITNTKKKEFNKFFQANILDTILLGSEEGYLLYTDDWALRSFAATEFDVKGTWTQSFIIYLLEKELITKEEYSEYVSILVNNNYQYTSINDEDILKLLKLHKWNLDHDVLNMLDLLVGNITTDAESAITIAANVIYKLWSECHFITVKTAIINKILEKLVIDRNSSHVLIRLRYLLQYKFNLEPVQWGEVYDVLSTWSGATNNF